MEQNALPLLPFPPPDAAWRSWMETVVRFLILLPRHHNTRPARGTRLPGVLSTTVTGTPFSFLLPTPPPRLTALRLCSTLTLVCCVSSTTTHLLEHRLPAARHAYRELPTLQDERSATATHLRNSPFGGTDSHVMISTIPPTKGVLPERH